MENYANTCTFNFRFCSGLGDAEESGVQDNGLNPPTLTNDIDSSGSKYLGKTFRAPGKHRAMPKVTIKHIENTCQVGNVNPSQSL